jgi:hypothetical protein
VLSKLDFFEFQQQTAETESASDVTKSTLEHHLLAAHWVVEISPASGGTLGVCFNAKLSGVRRFIKTHLPGPRARENLAKEGEILFRVYGESIILDRFGVRSADGEEKLYLLMAALAPLPAAMSPNEVSALIASYTTHCADLAPSDLGLSQDLEHYLDYGNRALTALVDSQLIGPDMASELNRLITMLRAELGALPRCLCHGDLGPKNSMPDGRRPIAIDWDDAFWGVPGYDYLYWLTFMDNRRFMNSAAFGQTGLSATIEYAILALIVLLKSFLSVRSGAHVRNAVPIEKRLTEVLNIPRI